LKIQILRDKNDRGFTLIELLLTLALGSILMLCIILLLSSIIESNKVIEANNEILSNGKYALEYIKKEVRTADMIISSDKFKRLNEEIKNNFGFVIVKYNPNDYYKYGYSIYYLENNKIIRVATNSVNFIFPDGKAFSGHNTVAEYIQSIEGTTVDFESRIIKLSLTLLGNKQQKLGTFLGIRCPVIY